MLPNYIIAGAQKAGTTSVFSVLKDHPDIYLPGIKEVHFFDNDENYNRGLEFYSSFFEKIGNEKIILDITPNYMYIHEVPKRIKKNLTNIKLIFLLRDPIKRAYSNYWQNIRIGIEKREFPKIIRGDNQYVDKSMYFKHLLKFLDHFSKEQIIIFKSEEMFLEPKNFYKKLFSIFDIEYFENLDYTKKENYARIPKFRIINNMFYSQSLLMKKIESHVLKR